MKVLTAAAIRARVEAGSCRTCGLRPPVKDEWALCSSCAAALRARVKAEQVGFCRTCELRPPITENGLCSQCASAARELVEAREFWAAEPARVHPPEPERRGHTPEEEEAARWIHFMFSTTWYRQGRGGGFSWGAYTPSGPGITVGRLVAFLQEINRKLVAEPALAQEHIRIVRAALAPVVQGLIDVRDLEYWVKAPILEGVVDRLLAQLGNCPRDARALLLIAVEASLSVPVHLTRITDVRRRLWDMAVAEGHGPWELGFGREVELADGAAAAAPWVVRLPPPFEEEAEEDHGLPDDSGWLAAAIDRVMAVVVGPEEEKLVAQAYIKHLGDMRAAAASVGKLDPKTHKVKSTFRVLLGRVRKRNPGLKHLRRACWVVWRGRRRPRPPKGPGRSLGDMP